MNRQTTDWKKIFAIYVWQGLIARLSKDYLQFNGYKDKQSNYGQKDLNRHFTKKDIKMTNKQTKKCSTSLIIMETQIKSQWDTTTYPLEWLKLKWQH